MSALQKNNLSLGDRIAKLAAELTVGEHALVTAIGEFEDSGQWAREGAISCAHWLSWRIGMSPEASRERVRVAKALRELPRIDEAFRVAELSYSKVRAMTRVATPANEELLVQMARASTAAQLESICRKFKRCLPTDATEAEARRRMTVRETERGTLRISIELPADEGARFLAAVDSGRAGAEGTPTSRLGSEGSARADTAARNSEESAQAPAAPAAPLGSQRTHTTRVDGLMTMVESWFAEGPKPRRGGAPHEVVLHVSAETLGEVRRLQNEPCIQSSNVEPHGRRVSAETSEARSRSSEASPFIEVSGRGDVSAETPAGSRTTTSELAPVIDVAGGVAVSAETARRLCCDASVSAVVESEGRVLDVGRKRRTVPAAMARALEAREGRTCSFPGCDHTLFVEKHHIQHWAHGGKTSLKNLCQLCRFHHTFVHEHGWRVKRTDAGLEFITPRGRVVRAAPKVPAVAGGALEALVERAGLELDDVSLQTEGWGDPVDYVQVIDALLRETFVQRTTNHSRHLAASSREHHDFDRR